MRLFRSLPAVAAIALLSCKDSPSEPPAPTTLSIAPAAPQIEVGTTTPLTATVVDQHGKPYTPKALTWKTGDGLVASVNSATGATTGIMPGTTQVTATADGLSGSVTVIVTPVPVTQVVVKGPSSSVPMNQRLQLEALLTDRTGMLAFGRQVAWSSNAQNVATVDANGLVSGVAMGTATITATSEGRSGSLTIIVTEPLPAPTIASMSAETLVPGTSLTITGANFGAAASTNLVTIRGVVAPITSAAPTQLTVTVPCVNSGSAEVRVTSNNVVGVGVMRPVVVTQRTIALGQALITTSASESACNEITPAGGNARYVVAVFSNSTSANNISDFVLAGNTPAPGAPAATMVAAERAAARLLSPDPQQAARDRAHFDHLERERALLERMRGTLPRRSASSLARSSPASQSAIPTAGEARNFYFTFTGGCNDTTRVMPTRAIYIGAKAIIWEDTTNAPSSLTDPALAGYYERLGRIYDQEQHESVKATFGDPLLRDADTDNDGRIHMVFSKRLNGTGAAAYVTGCDQYPPSTFVGSNHGQVFYGMVPLTTAPNVGSTASPDGWFYFMARTVVHEVKHIASISARVANDAPSGEASWLEEGTARHAEEVWVRKSLHNVGWKANTGFGSAGTNGIYCDFHPESGVCNAADPLRRPGYGMRRHFHEIRNKLLQPWNWSPYGDGTGQSGAVFYQTTWSLVRYAIDRYGTSDAAFLTALTNARISGTTNLATVAGTSLDRLIGGWALALYADDLPGLASPSADIQFPTWNMRDIYASLNTDPSWSGVWNTAYPVTATPLPFGSFTSQQDGVRGGAFAYFELSGNAAQPQLLNLRATSGGVAPGTLRIAVARIQ